MYIYSKQSRLTLVYYYITYLKDNLRITEHKIVYIESLAF